MKPLTDERPLLIRPMLATALGEIYGKAHGANLAIMLERAHVCQQARGLRDWVSIGGRPAELVCFRWSLEDLERDFPFLSRSTIQRAMKMLTAGRQSQPSLDSADLLWKVRVRKAGRVCEDRYSVNYAAVPEVSKLHRAAAVDPPPSPPPPGSKRPSGVVNLTSDEGQDDLFFGQNDQPSLRDESGVKACMHALLPGQIDQGAAALVEFGQGAISPEDARDVVGRWPDGPRRAMVACENVARLAAAGFAFESSPVGYAISLMKKNRGRLTDEEVGSRVAWQRANRARSPRPAAAVDFNQPKPEEQERARRENAEHRRQEAALDALDDQAWQAWVDRARPVWQAQQPGPFPADARASVRLRAIVRGLMFGGVAARGDR